VLHMTKVRDSTAGEYEVKAIEDGERTWIRLDDHPSSALLASSSTRTHRANKGVYITNAAVSRRCALTL
jgi:hypothetical protein